MPILTIQRQLRELGRIRLGQKGDRGQPVKLRVFRLTSASRALIEAVADVYGGTVSPWKAPDGDQFEVVIEHDTLDVLVPPGDNVLSQWFELWTGAGCQRRCDGITEVIGDQPCLCPSDDQVKRDEAAKGRACKPTTRLSVILQKVPDVGVWRLESHGYNVAAELPGSVEICRLATARGVMLPAQLRLVERSRKVPGRATKRFVVPILELPSITTEQLLPAGAHGTAPALTGGAIAALPEGSSVQDTSMVPVSPADADVVSGKTTDATPAAGPEPSPEASPPPGPQATPPVQPAGRVGVPDGSSSRAGEGPATEADPRDQVAEATPAGEAAQAAPASPPDDPATAAQIRALMKQGRRRYGARAEEAIKELTGVASFTELTKQKASAVIDQLNRPEDTPAATAQKALEGAFGPLEEVEG